MEEKKGLLSHFGGLIRFIVFLILLGVVAFLVVRWAGNRQSAKQAQEAAQTGQKSPPEGTSQAPDESTEPTTPTTTTPATVPSGIADSSAPTPGSEHSSMPNTGMESDVVITTVLLSSIVYLFSINRKYKQTLRQS